jgi:hypothetical protein
VRRPADTPLQPLRLGIELTGNFVVTFRPLEDHEVFEQPGPILVERTHFDRASGPPARRQEAMPVCHRA